jgi:hypothetical protein
MFYHLYLRKGSVFVPTSGNVHPGLHRDNRAGCRDEDPEQRITFPPRSTLDQVIDRIIAIVQDAARK